jgi:hypothetical protein
MPETPIADRLAAMTDAELIEDAARQSWTCELGHPIRGDGTHVSAIPAAIGEGIRKTCGHGQLLYRHMIPMNGPTCIHAEWKLSPDGTMILQLQDTNGCPFWNGVFRPAA